MSDPLFSQAVFAKPGKVQTAGLAKEQLTAYQRWELASFDAKPDAMPAAQSNTERLDAVNQKHPAEQPSAEQLLARQHAAAELQATLQQARETSYAEGQQAGYAEGIAQAQLNTAQLQTLLDNLQMALNQIDEQIAQSLLDLSLEIARKMVLATLQTQPEIILKIVSTAIASLPHFNQNAHLVLHPDDAALVREQMGEQLAQSGWQLFTDEQIERGGCRVETAHSNIDASNATRWEHIVESIGQDRSWMN